jgi:hypothetical protein
MHRGRLGRHHDLLARRSRSQGASEFVHLRGLRAAGRLVDAASDVHGVRLRRLWRLVQEQARDCAFPSDAAPDRSVDRARRRMGLVLHRPPLVRKASVSRRMHCMPSIDSIEEVRHHGSIEGRTVVPFVGGCFAATDEKSIRSARLVFPTQMLRSKSLRFLFDTT